MNQPYFHLSFVLMTDAGNIDPGVERDLLEGLKKLEGRGTLADIVRATGMPREKTEQDLKVMLSLYKSHLEVDENGDLLYLFDTSFERRKSGGAQL